MGHMLASRKPLVIVATYAIILIVMLAGCGGQSGHSNKTTTPTTVTATISPVSNADVSRVIVTVLDNIKQNGFDPAANNGQGGLWIDWRFGTQPLETNGNMCTIANAQPSCQGSPAHDRLTDLRYLHNLLWYQLENPSDTQFQSEVQRYTPIVQSEFASCTDVRGWIFDEWLDMYAFTKDNFYRQCASTIADYYFTQWYHPASGALYQTSSTSPNGVYRTEDAIGMGTALIEAGATFNRSDWTQAGKTALAYLKSHAYLSQYHIYLHLLGDVVNPDGSANANPTILRTDTVDSAGGDSSNVGGSSEPRDGGNVKAGSIGSEAFAFLRAYQATHDQTYLNDALDLLSALSPTTNPLGLWDSTNLGYFYALRFDGTDYQHPGTPKLRQGEKEAGRQQNVLRAVHLANTLTGAQLHDFENALLDAAVNHAYYASGHGYLYSMLPNWEPRTRNGQTQNFVTTESMGIALEALLSTVAEPPIS